MSVVWYERPLRHKTIQAVTMPNVIAALFVMHGTVNYVSSYFCHSLSYSKVLQINHINLIVVIQAAPLSEKVPVGHTKRHHIAEESKP
jgi:hypothetical protein